MPDAPELEGYLNKLKHKSSYFGSWTNRYFKVDPQRNTLDYYSSSSNRTPKHTINLHTLTGIQVFDKTTFELSSKTGSFLLRCKTAEEQNTWFRSFEHYIERLVSSKSFRLALKF